MSSYQDKFYIFSRLFTDFFFFFSFFCFEYNSVFFLIKRYYIPFLRQKFLLFFFFPRNSFFVFVNYVFLVGVWVRLSGALHARGRPNVQ